jgi:hypothetical protein
MDQFKSGVQNSDEPLMTRRLDGSTKESLAASIRMMPDEERGWITLKEAAILFSPEDDEYAFREIDGGTQNLAAFVAEESRRCRFAFVEGYLYFTRTTDQRSEMWPSLDERAVQKDLPPWSEGIRWTINQVPSNWITFFQRAKSVKIGFPKQASRCGNFLLTLKYQYLDSDIMKNIEDIASRMFGKTVKRDSDGAVNELILHQNGDRSAPKLSASELPPELREIEPRPPA